MKKQQVKMKKQQVKMRQKNCKKNGESLGKQSASEARSGTSTKLNVALCMPAGRNQLWEVQNE